MVYTQAAQGVEVAVRSTCAGILDYWDSAVYKQIKVPRQKFKITERQSSFFFFSKDLLCCPLFCSLLHIIKGSDASNDSDLNTGWWGCVNPFIQVFCTFLLTRAALGPLTTGVGPRNSLSAGDRKIEVSHHPHEAWPAYMPWGGPLKDSLEELAVVYVGLTRTLLGESFMT